MSNFDIKFNPTIVDNFFTNPDIIRNFGLNLPKEKQKDGHWPGERSEELYIIDNDFNHCLIMKILSTHFDLRHVHVTWERSNITFQVIKPFDDVKDSLKNIGWVHQDEPGNLVGLIYLTPNADLNSGTSIYKIKPEEEKNYLRWGTNTEKNTLYTSGKIKEDDYNEAVKKHNDRFVETIRVQNIYNRMITYDSNHFHKANSFFTGTEDRMTLVFFIKNINVDKFPVERTYDDFNFDSSLQRRINYLNNE